MTTPAPIDFWFDFISPYAYLASRRIECVARRHGRTVRWRPMLLGVAVMRVMGLRPLMETPLKADYIVRDLQRLARRDAVVLGRDPRAGPMNPLPAARAMAWLDTHRRDRAAVFAGVVFDRYWRLGAAMDQPDAVREALLEAGLDAEEAQRAMARSPGAELLQASVDQGIAQGVFGAPFFVVDGEPFWGQDRLADMERWLGDAL